MMFIIGLINSRSSSELSHEGTGTNIAEGASQIVPPIDPSMVNVVSFDISKGQHTDDCPQFISDMQAAGYTVATIDIDQGIPANVKVIIVVGTRANLAIDSAYNAADGTLLADWVSSGGELLITGDWGNYGVGTEELMKAFGVTPQKNMVTDNTDFDTGNFWVIYQSDNFAVHPIFAGVVASEHFAGESLATSAGAIITADADANPSGAVVAVALEWGSGRVAMFGDSNWIGHYVIEVEYGYNKVDNAKVAMNTIYWLSPYALVGDLNSDGIVNIQDVVIVSGIYGSEVGDPDWNPKADMTSPYGKINMLDLVTLAAHYGEGTP